MDTPPIFDENDMKHNDISHIQVIVPRTAEVDKGKTLKLAFDWGKLMADANIARRALEAALF